MQALLPALLSALDPGLDVAVVRDGAATVVGAAPSEVLRLDGAAAFDALDRIDRGWWAGWLAYELGHAVEPVVPRGATGGHDRGPAADRAPDVVLARFDARVELRAGTPPAVIGDGPARGVLLDALARAVQAAPLPRPVVDEPWATSLDRAAWCDAVRTVQEHILAGDCYQVNLTRRLHAATPVDPRALHAHLVAVHPAPHAALVQLAGSAVVSASPERFLRVAPAPGGLAVETRPIKGTAADPEVLARSAKDRAENVMIVDLARNDLGRVCEPGSISVPALCALERHPGLVHLVSTVHGTLRAGVGWGGLVRATFPPASVTGAPKPRVLQIIEDLEPVPRGVYCGAVGWIDADRRRADLNVAIRTFVVDGAGVQLGVGAGIVADSDPESEWAETELKAARLRAAIQPRPAAALPDRATAELGQ